MKLTTTFALASLCLVGTACSQAADSEEAQAVIATETAQIEDEYTGSLNLNLPSTTLSDDSTSGALNLRIGQDDEDDGLLIRSGEFGTGNFDDEPSTILSLPEQSAESGEEVIRLDPK